MIYKSFLPGPLLSAYVRNYTIVHFKFNSEEPIPFKQRPPKSEQGIVFYIKGFVNLQNAKTGALQTPAPVSIFSNQMDKKHYHVSSEFFIFTIFFHAGVLHRLIRLPMVELDQNFHDAELFFGKELQTIHDQLASAANYSSMITIVEQFLFEKLKRLARESVVDNIATYLLNDPTEFSLDAIAKQACLSTKQFYRKFIERIGISPKYFSRLARFNHAYQYKNAHPNLYWSSIAHQFGYTDYHHLEKEFKEFTGLTPQQWITEDQASPERILQLR